MLKSEKDKLVMKKRFEEVIWLFKLDNKSLKWTIILRAIDERT